MALRSGPHPPKPDMSDEIVCSNCGIDDHLSGERPGEVIHITCAACQLARDRDPSPRCCKCRNHDVEPAPAVERRCSAPSPNP